MLTFALLIIGLVVYVGLWSHLPRRMLVLPGEGWTFSLTIIYDCLTIVLLVGLRYLMEGFVAQRQQFLWVVSAVSAHLRSTVAERAASAIAMITLVVVILLPYRLAAALSTTINGLLDPLFGAAS